MWFTLIGLIPGLLKVVENWQKNKLDAQVAITTAKLNGDRDKAVEIVKLRAVEEHEATSRLGIIAANKILTLLIVAFAIPLLIFFWKCILWDNVLGWGTTDPIRGQVADWANTIIAFIFGAPTALALGKMYLSRG